MSSIPSVKPLPRGGTVERWQAPAVGVAPEPEPAPAPQDGRDGLLTAERLAEIEEQAREEGFRSGFDEGVAAGRAAGRDEVETQAKRLAALVDSIAPQLRVLDEALLAQLAELVLAVARQFVRRELRSQPGEIVRVIREALGALPASDSRVRVYLNGEDAALVREALTPDSLERPLQILEDMALAQGGARLETDTSVVDASVETRVATIAARLLGDERRAVPPADSAQRLQTDAAPQRQTEAASQLQTEAAPQPQTDPAPQRQPDATPQPQAGPAPPQEAPAAGAPDDA